MWYDRINHLNQGATAVALAVPTRAVVSLVLALSLSLGAVFPVPARADLASVLLDVPWRTQIDGSPDQHDNAGLVAVGMVLSAYGRGYPTAVLRLEHDRLAGATHALVTPASLASLAASVGLVPQAVAPAADRSTREVRRQLEQGHPVLMWLGRDERPRSGRWVVAVGYTAQGTLACNDPGEPLPVYGQTRLLSQSEVTRWLEEGAVAIALGLAPRSAEAAARGGQGTSQPQRGGIEAAEVADVAQAGASGEPASLPADDSPYWWRLIETYAAWFGLDPYYVAAVVLAESGGDPNAVGDQGHSIGLMQLHDSGFGSGLYQARYDPALNLWHGTKALAEGMARFGDPFEAYARYYNPGGQVAGERVMNWYRWLRELGEKTARTTRSPAAGRDGATSTTTTPGGLQ